MITIKKLSPDMVVQVEKTPLIKLEIINGVKLYNSDCVIVIAARPGIGKTNTACNLNARLKPKQHMANRGLSFMSRYSPHTLKNT